jgi:ketosteroid isomerase-like protein
MENAMSPNVELVPRLFNAVEDGDLEALLDRCDAAVEIHEADSPPDGSSVSGGCRAAGQARADDAARVNDALVSLPLWP